MKRRALSSLLFCLLASHGASAAATIDYVDSAGRQWRNLNDTLHINWYAVDAICPNDGVTPCVGSATPYVEVIAQPPIDLTGWVWAIVAQVHELAAEVTGLGAGLPLTHLFERDTWASGAFVHFEATPLYSDVDQFWVLGSLRGYSATEHPMHSVYAYAPFIRYQFDFEPGDTGPDWPRSARWSEWAGTAFYSKDYTEPEAFDGGVWLFQPPAEPVPEPATLFLVGSTLGALGFIRRRRQ